MVDPGSIPGALQHSPPLAAMVGGFVMFGVVRNAMF